MDIKNTLANWYSNRSGTDSVFRSTSLEFPEISIDQYSSIERSEGPEPTDKES